MAVRAAIGYLDVWVDGLPGGAGSAIPGRARILLYEGNSWTAANGLCQTRQLEIEDQRFPIRVGAHACHQIKDTSRARDRQNGAESEFADVTIVLVVDRVAEDVGGWWRCGPLSRVGNVALDLPGNDGRLDGVAGELSKVEPQVGSDKVETGF